MAIALVGSAEIGAIFDEVNRKEYRLEADEAALSCLDTAFVELAHDYFYSVQYPGIEYPGAENSGQNCSIVSVTGSGPQKSVVVTGSAADPRYHITATITAQVLQSDNKISLLSETTAF